MQHRETKFREKIGDVNKKITDVSGLVTNSVLETNIKEVQNKILVVNDLVKKVDYDAMILEVKRKYFTTFDYI